jgi:hypothetical protein
MNCANSCPSVLVEVVSVLTLRGSEFLDWSKKEILLLVTTQRTSLRFRLFEGANFWIGIKKKSSCLSPPKEQV